MYHHWLQQACAVFLSHLSILPEGKHYRLIELFPYSSARFCRSFTFVDLELFQHLLCFGDHFGKPLLPLMVEIEESFLYGR